jgi:hypothetical protein
MLLNSSLLSHGSNRDRFDDTYSMEPIPDEAYLAA